MGIQGIAGVAWVGRVVWEFKEGLKERKLAEGWKGKCNNIFLGRSRKIFKKQGISRGSMGNREVSEETLSWLKKLSCGFVLRMKKLSNAH